MALTITMYPAGNGDTFLIRYATRDGERLTVILIDGGYVSTFRDHVVPDLARLAQSGGMIDLAVATHIDADHVSGLIHFFKENGPAEEPRIVPVHEVWHNCLRSIPMRVVSEASGASSTLSQGDSELLRMVRRRGYPRPVGEKSAASEISALQGSSLAALLLGGGYKWNGEEGRMPIVASPRMSRRIGPDIDVTVLGPTPIRLEELSNWWRNQLRHIGYTGPIFPTAQFDDAFEFLIASGERVSDRSLRPLSGKRHDLDRSLSDPELGRTYTPDTSITNGSSISLMVRVGKMRVLLLGDAWAPDTEAALREAFASDEPNDTSESDSTAGAEPTPGERAVSVVFDAIKVSHHGSRYNTSPALLGWIDAPRFLISTDGERHHHPDIEVLRAIVDRPATFRRELFFNYRTPASERMKSYATRPGATFSVHEGVRKINLGEEG